MLRIPKNKHFGIIKKLEKSRPFNIAILHIVFLNDIIKYSTVVLMQLNEITFEAISF